MTEKIIDYVDFTELQMFLNSLPTPDWDAPERQYHYPVSASKYDKCPQLKQRPFSNAFKMVRGSKYHEYYIPHIIEFMGLENGEYEYLHKINLSCNSCDSGSFPFGGSIDYYNKGKEWLIDFKFSESSYSTDSYIPQLSAYAYFSEFGMKKVEGKWTMAMGPVRSISILKIHPVTFECSENVITTPLTKDEIFTKAKNLHDYKKHGKDNYAPGINCRWCTDKNCKLKMK